MSGGRDFHRRPCSPFRLLPEDGTPRSLGRHHQPQSCTRSLCDLAVLLRCPTVKPAELDALLLRELGRKNEPLIRRELLNEQLQASQLLARDRHSLGFGAGICKLYLNLIRASQRHRCLERGLHRAPSRQRTPPVTDPRDEPLLDDVRQVPTTREDSPLACIRHQLECCLAIAILEVLPAQSMTMRTEQQLALGARDQSDLLSWVEPSSCKPTGQPARTHISSLGLRSGRHMGMSLPAARCPPSQFSIAAARSLRCRLMGGALG
jgi:hypothetical protein